MSYRLSMLLLALLMAALVTAALVSGRAFVGLFSYARDEQPISFWAATAFLSAACCAFICGAITG